MVATAHPDTFARDRLPPREQWPEFIFDRPEFRYPERLNCAAALLGEAIGNGWADRVAIGSADRPALSYRALDQLSNRIARVLARAFGLVPGNRVLIRSGNNPMFAACILAVWKAGGIVVPTMRLLRSRELRQVIDKARVDFALCDERLRAELDAAASGSCVRRIVSFGGTGAATLEAMAAGMPATFEAVDTFAEDIALIAFTSGTTGPPKAAAHFHRDVLVMCDGWPRSILHPGPEDVFCGTAPLAFTYGLGTMLCIPLRFGASVVLAEKHTPESLLQAIQEFRCTYVATVPTFFRQMAPLAAKYDLSSLRIAVSSGEALPVATRELFLKATGIGLIDGIGSTELMQTFISHVPERARRGATGTAIPGYQAAVFDAEGRPCPPGVTGRLAVKGPSGCLYLDDERQKTYVQHGWNFTGDAFSMDEDGYFWFQGRTDDLIVSAGYNISGLEVEAALLAHPAVSECAVVGMPDDERGQVVSAFVVLRAGHAPGPGLEKELKDFVKDAIAPYKYPRRIAFSAALPRSESGKLLRNRLREAGARDAA